MKNDYIPGSHYVIDQRTGFKVRAEYTKQEWTGLRTREPDIRNPQDFVTGRVEHIAPPFANPPVNYFLETNEVDDDLSLVVTRITVDGDGRALAGEEVRKIV